MPCRAPLATAAMAWALLHEALPAGFALAAALVLGGVWIAQSGDRAASAAPLDAGQPST